METKVKNGTPVNTKSLAAFLFSEMERLRNGDSDVQESLAQAQLARQFNNLLDYELRRTQVQIKLKESGENVHPELRNIESKAFDDAKSE